MPVKTFLRITTVLTAIIGAVLIILPVSISKFFLSDYVPGSEIFIRFLGSALVGYSYLNWYTAKYKQLELMHATLIGNFSTLMIALLISVIGMLDHSLKATGWLIVLLHFTIGFGFGYYLYRSSNNT